jgi:endonuclease/exonuclease/phosphatase family metal-dependent hydrolase
VGLLKKSLAHGIAHNTNMKIYSWNMLFRNKELDRAFDFISHSDFDVFCLQEVPTTFLERLKTLPYHMSYRIDVERIFPSGDLPNYVVILSKHAITSQGEIPFPDYWHLLPFRTRLFVLLMRPWGFSKIRNRGGMHVDIMIGEQRTRVFNLHLILAHPAWRLSEFEKAMAERDPTLPTIVCGDFNILESPHITPLNWLFGGKVRDVLHKRERMHIEKRFVEHALTNALRGNMTHPISRSQLDHILVSHQFSVENAKVIADSTGSDHHPIFVEVA